MPEGRASTPGGGTGRYFTAFRVEALDGPLVMLGYVRARNAQAAHETAGLKWPATTGLLVVPGRKPRSATPSEVYEQRFWAKVDKTDGCWPWAAGTRQGYGEFWAGRKVCAHRYAYELLVGPIPEELVIDHLCRNTLCCNPEHMEPVTTRENVLRGISPIAQLVKRTHCKRGHELIPENLLPGYRDRRCRECDRMRKRARVRGARAGSQP